MSVSNPLVSRKGKTGCLHSPNRHNCGADGFAKMGFWASTVSEQMLNHTEKVLDVILCEKFRVLRGSFYLTQSACISLTCTLKCGICPP